MTKNIYGYEIRFTKTGNIHKADTHKIYYAYLDAETSALRSWEFMAGIHGVNSIEAQNIQKEIDFLKAIKNQAYETIGA